MTDGLSGGEGLPHCGEVGWLSFLGFAWVNPTVNIGVERQIDLADTPKLAEAEDTLRNSGEVLKRLDAAEQMGSRHPLLRAVVLTYWKELLLLEVLRVGQHFLGLLKPLITAHVLIFQESQDHGETTNPGILSSGLTAIGCLIVLNLFEIMFSAHVDFYQQRLELRIGSALRGTVLVRCVQGRTGAAGRAGSGGNGPSGGQGPTVYNVLSFDVGPNVDVIWVVLGLWIFPLQFASTLTLLIHEVRGAALPGLLVIIAAKVFVAVLLFLDGLFRHRLLQAKDRRLGGCNECFNNIRTLQMLSWVGPFQDRIMESRREELMYRARRLWMNKMGNALDYSLSTIVTLATFAYLTAHERGDLKASVALPVISLIQNLIGPFDKIPTWINQYLVWRSAYDRVNDFLGLGVPRLAELDEESAEDGTAPPALRNGAVAVLDGCTLSWGGESGSKRSPAAGPTDVEAEAGEEQEPLLKAQDAFKLQGLDAQVRGGELLILVGAEGQGKSSVLQGLLGEMTVEAGGVHSPAIERQAAAAAGAQLPPTSKEARQQLRDAELGAARPSVYGVPYAAQEVLLLTGTVRRNILFGKRHEAAIYAETLEACALERDLAVLPAGDLTEVSQGGANLSGGQKARVGLARAVYSAALSVRERPGEAPLVLLDDPLCSLDRRVASEVCNQLFAVPGGLLSSCAVVLAAADPWFLGCLPAAAPEARKVALLRGGRVLALGHPTELCRLGFPEMGTALPAAGSSGARNPAGGGPTLPQGEVAVNPQEALESGAGLSPNADAPADMPAAASPAVGSAALGLQKTPEGAPPEPEEAGQLVKDEGRVEGRVKCATYLAYLESVGCCMLIAIAVALMGISLFQNFCNLWIVYWTSEHRSETKFHAWMSKFLMDPPTRPEQLIVVYAIFVACFLASNFAGHALEILGGVSAARTIFNGALRGTLARPFRWWDANPTGRVLNRFSEDVEVMDAAITNILGVIFGAVLYLVSHSVVLAIANPLSLVLLPVVILVLEWYARYYRATIREAQRIFLVSMGTVYQEMVEAILGRVTVRAFDTTPQVLCSALDRLDRYQRNSFTKTCVRNWVQLRMSLIGYILGIYNTLQPLLQYVGFMHAQSAALVGFSINYSQDIMGIIKQLIMNYSDLEMQLISIERLQEYAEMDDQARAPAMLPPSAQGLVLDDVEVCYREGLPPALTGVSLRFPPCQATAIVGRTGAGKSSLLLSVLQLVPYTGRIEVGGRSLAQFDPEDVRRRLVGVVPQHPVVFCGSLRWNLDPEGARSDAELLEALQTVGLKAALGIDQGGLAEELGSGDRGLPLSAGQRQLLCATRALLRRPRVVMLDEVTASLPPEVAGNTVAILINRFKDMNAAVLLVTHQEDLLSSCERVVTIDRGRVVGDSTRGAAAAMSI